MSSRAPLSLVAFSAIALALTFAAPTFAQDVTFPASDGETVHGTWYRADEPGGVVLAFHQGGASGKAEYAPIASVSTGRGTRSSRSTSAPAASGSVA